LILKKFILSGVSNKVYTGSSDSSAETRLTLLRWRLLRTLSAVWNSKTDTGWWDSSTETGKLTFWECDCQELISQRRIKAKTMRVYQIAVEKIRLNRWKCDL
jgi:hypothetical protein